MGGMSSRARVIVLNAALGPLDYRVPHGMAVAPGAIVVAPLGPRQLLGVVWEPDRLATEEVGDNRLRNLLGVADAPPIPAPLRRLVEWTAGYYLAPLASVLRMALASTSALEGQKLVVEYRATGALPDRLTPQRAQALERIGDRQGLVRELATIGGVSDGVIRGLVKIGAIEGVEIDLDHPFPRCPTPITRARACPPTSTPPPPRWSPRSRRATSSPSCSTGSPAPARPRCISKRSPPRSPRGGRRWCCCPKSP